MAVVRTFIAIHLTPQVLAELRCAQNALRALPGGSAARWVAPENMHLTLKFLGDVESRRLAEVYAAVDAAADRCGPLPLALGEMGCFPNVRRPRVVWAGLSGGDGRLSALAGDIDAALGKLGFAREQRRFQAHLTLARIRNGAAPAQVQALGRSVETHGALAGEMTAQAVAVVRSDLRPQGPLYTDLHTAPLRGLD